MAQGGFANDGVGISGSSLFNRSAIRSYSATNCAGFPKE
jgi:hypothetical protein